MKKQWVVVANGSLARFFGRTGAGEPLVALETLRFPEAGFNGHGPGSDCPGPGSRDHSGQAMHVGPLPGMRSKAVHPFALELARRLEEGVVDGEYESFWLIACSPLLSDIKPHLNRGVACRLKWTHDADLTGLDAPTLDRRLRELREPRELGVPAH
ncbi:MAG: host attachment protein [Hydrogenophaga sp.]|uniref:host attachment protein n=1 Tax=Hydrogenophaga sp. TaxID=1904254 RepID=UPI0026374DB8|nr:host attachment protein [Hydrogenophaga sp.]MDM7944106.1 host attachment protein [Hydrogenophaga sp.]